MAGLGSVGEVDLFSGGSRSAGAHAPASTANIKHARVVGLIPQQTVAPLVDMLMMFEGGGYPVRFEGGHPMLADRYRQGHRLALRPRIGRKVIDGELMGHGLPLFESLF